MFRTPARRTYVRVHARLESNSLVSKLESVRGEHRRAVDPRRRHRGIRRRYRGRGVVGIRVPRYSTPGALWCRHSQPSTRNLARQLHDAIRRADARVSSNSATGLAGRPRRVACAAAAPREAVKASQQGGGEITSSPLTSRCRARKNQEPRLLHLLIHRQGLASRAGACYTKQVAPAPDSVGTWPSLAFLSGCPAAACVAAL